MTEINQTKVHSKPKGKFVALKSRLNHSSFLVSIPCPYWPLVVNYHLVPYFSKNLKIGGGRKAPSLIRQK